MTESHLVSGIAGAMQFLVAVYALRLNRRYGTVRVGWSLFGAFTLLAAIHLMQCINFSRTDLEAGLEVNGVYMLISFLLLIGMLHLETMLKERLRVEAMEKQMRAELESEVKSKTAHLNRALEELMREVDNGKRMSAIIKSGETQFVTRWPHLAQGVNSEIVNRVLGPEWVAHF